MNTLLPVPVLANITYSVMPARMSGTIVVKRERAPNAALASHGSNRVRRGLSRRATSTSAALINFGDRTVSRRNRGARTQEKAAGPVTVG